MATTDQVFVYYLVRGALSDDVAPLFPALCASGPANADVEPLFQAVI